MLANFRRVSAQRCSPISDLTFFFSTGRGKETRLPRTREPRRVFGAVRV